ncbi:hypothetical protein OSB04_019073 [Centaurea solstitialis]|uniref:Reverse transcriptase Ty1/copia-type domain-containing protein n=1 Tax=Centaurea solstitialis TaxID=347529 RepID=A0AA38WC14_9ASTR|nr:hypothetical protein OSB04_019073 [Centaurea solstitialis]
MRVGDTPLLTPVEIVARPPPRITRKTTPYTTLDLDAVRKQSLKVVGKPSVNEIVGKQLVKVVEKTISTFTDHIFSDARFVGKLSVKPISDCFPTVRSLNHPLMFEFLTITKCEDLDGSDTSIAFDGLDGLENFRVHFSPFNCTPRGEHRNRVPAFGTGTVMEPPVPEPEPTPGTRFRNRNRRFRDRFPNMKNRCNRFRNKCHPITQVTPEPDQPTSSEDFSQTTVSEPAPTTTNLLPDPSLNETSTSGQVYQPPAIRWTKDHPIDQVLGNPSSGVKTRRQSGNICLYVNFISENEPKESDDALRDPAWVSAMQEELAEFIRNNVWLLVPGPRKRTIIGSKWIFRNKLDEVGKIIQNKTRLVAQGYRQEEGIDYDETFAPVLGSKQFDYSWPLQHI